MGEMVLDDSILMMKKMIEQFLRKWERGEMAIEWEGGLDGIVLLCRVLE